MLNYRNTPPIKIYCNNIPAQLFLQILLRYKLPTNKTLLKTKIIQKPLKTKNRQYHYNRNA